jgi:hypothetical protein
MADVVAKLRLESQEYDQKLKRATEGLMHYADGCRKAGGTLEHVDEGMVEFARSLGKMETVSTSARGQLNELTKAFTEMSFRYEKMTEAEKNGEFGKALKSSLDELKGRISDTKTNLDDVSKSLNGGGGLSGALDAIAGKFGMSIEQLTKFGGVLGAASTALKVSKDAFFASEQNIDEWGRVVASGEAVYEGFLTALNTGDISGFLNNINTIVSAAREAYNELDRLSTQKAIDNPRMKAQQTENERMRAMLRTGRYIAPNDGRKATMAEGTLLTEAQKQRLAQQLENGLKTTNSIVRSEIDQTTKAINALYKEQASVLQMSSKEFRAGTASMEEFDKRLEGYRNYVNFEREHTYNDGRSAVSHRDNVANPYEQYKAWGVFKDDGKLFQKINDLINQRASLQSQNYSSIAQAYRSINTATKPGSGGGGGRGGSGGGGNDMAFAEGSIAAQSKLVSELQKKWNEAGEDMRTGYLIQLVQAENKLKEMQDQQKAVKEMLMNGPVDGVSPVGLAESLTKTMDEIQMELDANPLKLNIEVNDEKMESIRKMASLQKAAGDVAHVVGSIGQAFNAIEDPAAKVVGTISEAIAAVALGYAQATVQAAELGPWAWVAFAATGMAQMISMISSIHQSTGYAQGGIVKGNSYSGDNMMFGGDGLYGLNAGEVVLTKAMQGNLASQLQESSVGGGGGVQVARISGEQIYVALNRYLKRSGQGELMTWG